MEVRIMPQAQEEFDELPDAVKDRVNEVFARLEKWPQVSGVKRLTGDWKGLSRIRTGDYRVVFRLFEAQELIRVERIAHRREVYD